MEERAIIALTLEEVWSGVRETVYLGYCPHCGRLNLKAKIVGHFDDWTLTCPGCGKHNHCGSLIFKTQTKT